MTQTLQNLNIGADMGKRKFIEHIQDILGISKPEYDSKKAAIKELLQKLKSKQAELKLQLKVTKEDESKKDLKESIEILKKQIKKGENLLDT
jgi:uncharacterized protein (DUF2147 family)